MGRIVNQTELVEIVGVDDTTLWRWQKEGMPIKARNLRGQSNQYDTAEIFAWVRQWAKTQAAGGETQEQRLKRVQADKIEMEIAQLRRELVPAEEIEARSSTLVLAAQKKLRALPATLAKELMTLTDEGEMRRALREAIDQALVDLSIHDDPTAIIEDYVARLFERVAHEPVPAADGAGAGALGAAGAEDGRAVGGAEAVSQREEL